ncbi:hypothetical protein BABINDRAFT_5830 [Babjeviella inositovora NRRL Y-12698]|uniref:K Homology domain-containing protein n=1 Tax=Babjeviella inositovora NRRL Y-12698 TaxID=984486 RepID=A0A1E3QZA5_9ASCO|nr:uncharacterized protein BABINDRAFT_5830 [Babjeviella inositovora NRRL Y-12698]ODQ82941.1 hypothetical protein BABINDRAFT_5830 [Babjeviella inositovora NRRL Y-12698]
MSAINDSVVLVFSLPYYPLFKTAHPCLFSTPTASTWKNVASEATKFPILAHLLNLKKLSETALVIHNLDLVSTIVALLNKRAACHTSLDLAANDSNTKFQLIATVQGNQEAVRELKNVVLQGYSPLSYKKIRVEPGNVFTDGSYSALSSVLLEQLTLLASHYCVEISICEYDLSFQLSDALVGSSELNEDGYLYVYIFGSSDMISVAETKAKILLSTLAQCSEVVESVEFPLSLLPLIGGTDLSNFNQLATTTNVDLLLPDVLPHIFTPGTTIEQNQIYISGESQPQVTLAKHMLRSLAIDTAGTITKLYSDEMRVMRGKLELLMLNHQNDLVNLMYHRGVFLQLEPLGTGGVAEYGKIVLQGLSAESIKQAENDIMTLVRKTYRCAFFLNQSAHRSVDADTIAKGIQSTVSRISTSGLNNEINNYQNSISIVYDATNASFEITGDDINVKDAVHQLLSILTPSGHANFSQFIYEVELSAAEKDFIGGKKNGKMIRIMNNLASNVIIKYNPSTNSTFLIELISSNNDYHSLISALQLLEDELPFEYNLNIPEAYHKLMIGSGGLMIQQIMRKYNVFVKFTNSNSINESLSSLSFRREANVMIKCPMKNSKNIIHVEKELLGLVDCYKSDLHYSTYFRLFRNHYRLLLSKREGDNTDVPTSSTIIRKIETTTNTFINFPTSEPSHQIELVEIRGLHRSSEEAARLLCNALPQDYEVKIAYSPKFIETVGEYQNTEFTRNVILPLRLLFDIEVQVFLSPEIDDSSYDAKPANGEIQHSLDSLNPPFHRILLSCYPEKRKNLDDAIEIVVAYLRSSNFLIIEKNEYSNQPIIKGSAATAPFSNATQTKRQRNLHQDPHLDDPRFQPQQQYFAPPVSATFNTPFSPSNLSTLYYKQPGVDTNAAHYYTPR